ncbi:MAG: GEVED domain-containing protein [Bacteroidetes bacterium]|nr:GEVED domain-containing protein [Bacteroidota bacterium]
MKKKYILPILASALLLIPGSLACQAPGFRLTLKPGNQIIHSPMLPNTLLYGQLGAPSNESGIASQDFPDGPEYNCQAADDFIVPAGTLWTIDEIFCAGGYYPGVGVAQVAHLYIYANDPVLNIPFVQVVAYLNHAVTSTTGGDLTFSLTADPVILAAGHYWISIQPYMNGDLYGQWFWHKQESPTILSEYQWRNPGGGFGIPAALNWVPGAFVLGGTDQNLTFGLYGTACTPLLLVGSVGASQTVCNGSIPAQLTGTPPLNGTSPVYQWQLSTDNVTFTNIPGATNPVYQPDVTYGTTWYRQMQNAAGTCGGPMPTNTVTITGSPLLIPNAYVNNSTCNGSNNGTISLTVSGGTAPYTYLWSNGSTMQNISQLSPGAYSVTITDAYGCFATDSWTVTEPPPILVSYSITRDCSVGSIHLNVSGGTMPYSYLWDYNGMTTKDLADVPAGTYTVIVTDANGCIETITITLTTWECDFGDLPDGYYTNRQNDGARSKILLDPGNTIRLGVYADMEPNGQPGPSADNDDQTGQADEDGVHCIVVLPFPGPTSLSFDILNTSQATAYLQGWIDFNKDGIFSDLADEHIIDNHPFPPGTSVNYPVTVYNPHTDPTGPYAARFRLSDQYGTGSKTTDPLLVPSGEVEDYYLPGLPPVVLLPYDYGDAPAPYPAVYPNGARHVVDPLSPLHLGNLIDEETNGQPEANALGDDQHGLADEDGVALHAFINGSYQTNRIFKGESYHVTVSVFNNTGANAYLQGWIDYDQNNVWDPNEQIVYDVAFGSLGFLQSVSLAYSPTVPAWAGAGVTFARFRLSDQPGVGPDQPAGNTIPKGEVEDYLVTILDECHLDTLLINTGIDRDDFNNVMNPGNRDGFWNVTRTPDNIPPVPYDTYVINRNSGWSNAFTESAWLGRKTNSNAGDLAGDYIYEFPFCMGDNTQAALSLRMLVDNSAKVFLNDVLILETIPSCGDYGFTCNPIPEVSVTGPFYLMVNVLKVVVHNNGDPSGFIMEGMITSTNHAIGYYPQCCLAKWVPNGNIASGQSVCYDFFDNIVVAGSGGTFTVQDGGSATFIAGRSISFMPGTTVQTGGFLQGYIATSGEYCNSFKSVDFEAARDTLNSNSPMSLSNDGFFTIYPNPTTGGFSLELKGFDKTAELSVMMYNMLGEPVFSADLTGRLKYDLSIAGKPDGVYFIRVVSGKHAGTGKIIKQ